MPTIQADALLHITELAPAEKLQCRFSVFYTDPERGGFIFSDPGDYCVRAEYFPRGSLPRILTNPLAVKVNAIDARFERAKQLWVEAQTAVGGAVDMVALYVSQTVGHTKPNTREMERIKRLFSTLKDAYPDSPYARYVCYSEAINGIQHLEIESMEEYRRACGRRIQGLADFIENNPQFPLLDHAIAELVLLQEDVDKEEARTLLQELLRRFPDSPVLREWRMLHARYRLE